MPVLATITRAAAAAAIILALTASLDAVAAPGDVVADRVIGQPNFISNTANNGGVSASSMNEPFGLAVDSAGRLWVAEFINNRILEYDNPLTSPVATRVIGQPDFTSNGGNNGGPPSASSLLNPSALAIDGAGRLWVVDNGNNRVLEYDTPLTSGVATLVMGQPDFTQNLPNNCGGTPGRCLFDPTDLALDNTGRLWIADRSNNRVLEFDHPLTNPDATRLYGQPSLNSNLPNQGGISKTSLSGPARIAVISGGPMWIADELNNRVLEYDFPLTNAGAFRVYGQPNFTSNAANNGGIGAGSLRVPFGVMTAFGRLWVADVFNHRVLEYGSPLASKLATRAFGQPNFTSSTANNGGISASSLDSPAAATVDSAGRLWIADAHNNRVLEYDPVVGTPAVGGVSEPPDMAALPSASSSSGHGRIIVASAAAVVLLLSVAASWRRRAASS
jgi:sugar lactone lactonase YvrE